MDRSKKTLMQCCIRAQFIFQVSEQRVDVRAICVASRTLSIEVPPLKPISCQTSRWELGVWKQVNQRCPSPVHPYWPDRALWAAHFHDLSTHSSTTSICQTGRCFSLYCCVHRQNFTELPAVFFVLDVEAQAACRRKVFTSGAFTTDARSYFSIWSLFSLSLFSFFLNYLKCYLSKQCNQKGQKKNELVVSLHYG